jgi:hypothetical protein
MYRLGRPVVETFRSDEQLYRRYRREDIVNGKITPAALKFPKKNDNTGQSVNRSLLSKPEDALWSDAKRYDGWGVYQFPATCLPRNVLCSHTGRKFTFFPKHVPIWNNYAHTEIWSSELPELSMDRYILPTEVVKKELRATIQKNFQIAISAV